MGTPFNDGRMRLTPEKPKFFLEDGVAGAARHLRDGGIDLIVTDPPYGIEGDRLHRHYNRKEEHVIDGYVEIPKAEYQEFSDAWIAQADRVLKPGGSLFVVSGYTNLFEILAALRKTSLREVNHIVWKYNFGVFTSRKFVSSHYHILYYEKPGGRRTFNRLCRFGEDERDEREGSLLYRDMEDVWVINREYKPGSRKNKNELPRALLAKILQYASREGDVVCDFFLGSFSTAKVAIAMNRAALGFEVNAEAYHHQVRLTEAVVPGSMLAELKTGTGETPPNRGRPWTDADLDRLAREYRALRDGGDNKGEAIKHLQQRFGRGRFSVLNALKKRDL